MNSCLIHCATSLCNFFLLAGWQLCHCTELSIQWYHAKLSKDNQLKYTNLPHIQVLSPFQYVKWPEFNSPLNSKLYLCRRQIYIRALISFVRQRRENHKKETRNPLKNKFKHKFIFIFVTFIFVRVQTKSPLISFFLDYLEIKGESAIYNIYILATSYKSSYAWNSSYYACIYIKIMKHV